MFFARKSCFSKKSLYNFFLSSFSTNSNVIPIKVRYSKSDYTNLVLALPYQNQKIFFINDKFTFNSLKEIFLLESPLSKINITYPVSLPLKGESNLLKYLKAKEIGEVNFSIDNNEYSLTNDASFLMNQIVEKVVKDSQNNKNSVLYWYNFCIQNKIPYTNTGTLAYFMRILNHHLEIYGMTNEIKNSDIEILFKKVLNEFSCPINQKLENLLEKNNELDSEIVQLEKDKENIEEIAKKRIIFYQKLIILMSLAQILSFYYMIFHVDWLGKFKTKTWKY